MDGTTKAVNGIRCKKHSYANNYQRPASGVRHARDWFLKACPQSFFRALQRELGIPERRRIFTLSVTVWLMIMQRLSGNGGTLAAVVSELVNGNGWDALEPCKRVREHSVSLSTGGFSQARIQIPVEAARRVSQHTFDQLHRVLRKEDDLRHRLFLLDGSSIELAHAREIKKEYGLAKNQNGESHWPVMRVVVLHHVATGLALPPEYGAMYGRQATGEQKLGERLMAALPPSAILVADRNFGIFSVMWRAAQLGHDVVIRLTRLRAESIHRGLKKDTDQRVMWTPTREDRRSNKELPQAAQVEGRLLVVDGEIGTEPLYLFTTLEEPAAIIAGLYKERWLIETDLRSLKEQVKLHSISAKTPQMAATELLLAVAAYNLIRAVMGEAAGQIGVDPRRLSFSRSQAAFWAFTRAVSQGCSAEKFEFHWKLLLRGLSQCKLPNRKRPSEPRAVWGKRSSFPLRKVTQEQN